MGLMGSEKDDEIKGMVIFIILWPDFMILAFQNFTLWIH